MGYNDVHLFIQQLNIYILDNLSFNQYSYECKIVTPGSSCIYHGKQGSAQFLMYVSILPLLACIRVVYDVNCKGKKLIKI